MKVDDVLEHYGILGMKWGVRRDRAKLRKLARQRGETRDWDVASDDFKKATTLKRKPLSQMTNDELNILNNRMQLERKYKELKKDQGSKGKQFVKKLLVDQAKQMASAYVQQQAGDLIKNLIKG